LYWKQVLRKKRRCFPKICFVFPDYFIQFWPPKSNNYIHFPNGNAIEVENQKFTFFFYTHTPTVHCVFEKNKTLASITVMTKSRRQVCGFISPVKSIATISLHWRFDCSEMRLPSIHFWILFWFWPISSAPTTTGTPSILDRPTKVRSVTGWPVLYIRSLDTSSISTNPFSKM